MKYIVSNLKEPIHFALSGTRNLVIETEIPIQVDDIEFKILQKRLGSQIKTVTVTDSSTKTTEETKEKTASVTESTSEEIVEETTEETEE